MLTRDQLTQNIHAMEQQGARPDEIQSYLDTFKGQQPPATPAPVTAATPAVDPRQSFTPSAISKVPTQLANAAKSVFNFFTGSEQTVGKEIASGLPASVTGEKQLNEANQSNATSD